MKITSTGTQDGRSDNLRGAGLMMLAMAGFVLNDTTVKMAGDTLPLAQLLFLRGVISTVLLYAVARRMGAIRFDLPAREWGLIALRSFADLGATFFFVTALLNMPLANVTAIMQALPLTVTLAAALVFREPLGWRRLSAIGIGFCGVLLIVRPGVEGFSAWSLFALAAVGLVTIRDLAARRLAHSTPSATVALVGALLIALFAALGTALEGWKPVDLRSGALVSVAGLLVIVGYIASVATMRVGDVGFVSPYRYTGMIWALLLGFVAFGEWPELPTLVGAAIVVATGLFTLYRERVTGRRDRAVAPPSTRV